MISKESREWIKWALDGSEKLRNFAVSLGQDPSNAKDTIEAFERGLYGDPHMYDVALQYVANQEMIYVHPVDHALLASAGIDMIFAMAFLHAFGPNYETSDWDGDEEEGSVRGMLHLITGSLEKPVGLTWLTLDRGSGQWILESKTRLDKHAHWRTDFRGNYGRQDPDILLEYQIPQSAIAGMADKLLSTLIQHPVLDQFELMIGEAHGEDEDIRLDIESDLVPRGWWSFDNDLNETSDDSEMDKAA